MQSLAPFLKSALFPAASAAAAAGFTLQRFFSTGGTKRLYVGNLSFQTKAEELAKHFGGYGSVTDVVIPLDGLGRSRGYAFVEMDVQGADSAQGSLNQSEFMGRTIFVNEARPKEDRPPRGDRPWRGRGRQQDDGGWGQQGRGNREEF